MDEFTIEGYKRPTIAIYINMFCPSIAIEGYKRHNFGMFTIFFRTYVLYNISV